jgi:outer membrane receptor protein involved in Fe transport
MEIKGVVVSLDGQPIFEAVVLHRDSSTSVLTDESGHFVLDVPVSGNITLIITHPAYLQDYVNLTPEKAMKNLTISLAPYIRQKKEIVVTALRYPEASISVPAAESVLGKENLEEKMPVNIAQSVGKLPGVSNIGAGGFSLVPNIRGLARRRILFLIDYARITSERRTGPSASFINPSDIEKIEVLRSSSSVLYGSDAIGGVIHILTRSPSLSGELKGGLQLRYGTTNQEKNIGFHLEGGGEKSGYYFSFHGNDAKNYQSPEGPVLQSQYTQASFLGKYVHKTEKREVVLSFLGSRGYDIGKANQDSASNPTCYPLENQNFLQIQWKENNVGQKGELSFQAYVNPHALETKIEKLSHYKVGETFSRNQSLDYGFHASYGKKIGDFRMSLGTDYFGRFNSKARNTSTSLDPFGRVTEFMEEWPYKDGKRNDLGTFISLDYMGLKNIDILSGVRLDILSLQALPGGMSESRKSRYQALTGFVGGSWRVAEPLVAFVNLSRAYRVPSLSELFYSGITGRGMIISQPGLKPETSLNLDGGLKLYLTRLYAGLYLFHYRINNLIERYLTSPRIYTYGNVDRGQISGYEIEVEWYPRPGWKIFGNYFSFRGQSHITGDPLNDIPPSRLFIGSKLWLGRFIFELNSTLQEKKENPGPAEIAIPSYEVFSFEAGYFIGSAIRIHLIVSNFTNRSFLARPDPDAVFEPGRSLLIGFRYNF